MGAAINGHLDMLQWARANDATGAVWDEDDVRRYTGGSMQQEVLRWLAGLSAP
jgi:hypothetical protein